MLKNRLIFALLYNNGKYMLSRNFTLQSVGDINWLKESYDYNSIAHSIDELLVLNVERGQKNITEFCKHLKEISRQYFMPLAAGGGIKSVEDAYAIMDCGVDKLVLNTVLFTNPDLVKELIKIFGSQCIIASIDYRKTATGTKVFIENGSKEIGMDVLQAAKYVENLGAGEIYLTSINDDGTGEGYDLANIKKVAENVGIPVIASGGCGRCDQFVDAYNKAGVKAAATADLFNFMADALAESRRDIINSGFPMAKWDIKFFEKLPK
jgi:cyclase